MTSEPLEEELIDHIVESLRGNGPRVDCPDERCNWAGACHGPNKWIPDPAATLARMLKEHLAFDPRHTDGRWIDRDGKNRQGFEYLDA